ncbi:MAG: hypothetical protein JRI23_34650, partial [Deltaproteobacteria bacterium]|nr:hypothetical protein [Deltaproteobacteria bacterium]MBW2537440.1 hypothetical protein [Deltaproteobacteria bacterium]
MRWYVEITSVGKGDSSERLCVEGGNWQKALLSARRARGEGEQLSGLSVELREQGCRAVDPMLRLSYEVSVAPDGAALDHGADGGARRGASSPPAATAEGAADEAVAKAAKSKRRALAQTMAFESAGAAVDAVAEAEQRLAAREGERGAASASEPPGTPVSQEELDDAPPPTIDYADRSEPDRTAGAAVVDEQTMRSADGDDCFQQLSSRDDKPSAESPLWYREYVFGLSRPVTLSRAEAWVRRRFHAFREEMATAPPGKVVNIALFDHLFESAPKRPPMITLKWKDWRGRGPEVALFPYDEGGALERPAAPVEVTAAPSEPPPDAAEREAPPSEPAPAAAASSVPPEATDA